MNILPLVFALLFILSIMSIEKFEQFKNMHVMQNEYDEAIKSEDRRKYNQRQERLYGATTDINHGQISFRPFVEKKMREGKYEEDYKEMRAITVDLIAQIYGHADFFKRAQNSRPQLIDELLDAIQEAAEKMPEKSMKRLYDIRKLQLEDPELHWIFYRMLKGTIRRERLKEAMARGDPLRYEKAYVSLTTFFNFDGCSKGVVDYSSCQIKLGLAPRELLMALYGNREMVDALIARRVELTPIEAGDVNEATAKFKQEFEGKQKPTIPNKWLDYRISTTDKRDRE